jgi:hypothetical protein
MRGARDRFLFRESQLRDARDDLGVHREFRARYAAPARASRGAAGE